MSALPTVVVKPKQLPVSVQFPTPLDTETFRAAWDDYLAYRRERKLATPKPMTVKAKLAECAEWGEARAIAAIRATIANGWQGIFEPKAGINGATGKAPAQPVTYTDEPL